MCVVETLKLRLPLLLLVCSLVVTSCTSSASSRFFGKTQAPKDNVLRYVSGSEPETLDPQVSGELAGLCLF